MSREEIRAAAAATIIRPTAAHLSDSEALDRIETLRHREHMGGFDGPPAEPKHVGFRARSAFMDYAERENQDDAGFGL